MGSLNLKLFDSLLQKPCELTVMELFAKYLIPRGYYDESKSPEKDEQDENSPVPLSAPTTPVSPGKPTTPVSPGKSVIQEDGCLFTCHYTCIITCNIK